MRTLVKFAALTAKTVSKMESQVLTGVRVKNRDGCRVTAKVRVKVRVRGYVLGLGLGLRVSV